MEFYDDQDTELPSTAEYDKADRLLSQRNIDNFDNDENTQHPSTGQYEEADRALSASTNDENLESSSRSIERNSTQAVPSFHTVTLSLRNRNITASDVQIAKKARSKRQMKDMSDVAVTSTSGSSKKKKSVASRKKLTSSLNEDSTTASDERLQGNNTFCGRWRIQWFFKTNRKKNSNKATKTS